MSERLPRAGGDPEASSRDFLEHDAPAGGSGASGEGIKTPRRLPPEIREEILRAVEEGIRKEYGYTETWKTLREHGVRVSLSTVRRYYYKSAPPKKRGEYLDRALRARLYDDVLRLREEGLSYNQILKKIRETYGIRLTKSQISYWVRKIHSPFGGTLQTNHGLKPLPELACIIGVVAGDGTTKMRKESGQYVIALEARDREFVEEFARCLGQVLGRPTPSIVERSDERFMTAAYSKELYKLLKKPIDVNRIKPFVEHCEECMRSFVRGFFDSEGSIDAYGHICCSNTDTELLQYVKKILHRLGIRATGPRLLKRSGTPIVFKGRHKTYMRKRDVYCIIVSIRDDLKFYKKVGFSIQRKQLQLENYLRKRGLLSTTPPLSSPSFSLSLV